MKLYLITQNQNTGYDTYDSAVVCAPDEDSARRTHPNGRREGWWEENSGYASWARNLEVVRVKLIGEAAPDVVAGVVCASFNAG